ncbi:uncharacterized protein LOC100571059 isoform X3 [Acyrthosiphon pisum]|uniref:Uncharacterized protein n=1 Tax=Acyrthosiphon pisum TaxID=7029 RepID=A0A8R2D7D6_ACYPI|nr:uncharacterized protein LOC100571059 isoform X3 [Acyrthosiphon pisum]|eukprot:XP_016663915.1 PREDICTED: uncharacterized protein LOC100571059 isoform X3 [Acyrthosiphon pisum]
MRNMSSDNTMPDNECHRCSAEKKEPVTRTCDEQKEILSSVVDDYYPWGKPGHGAPNDDGLRKRKIFADPPSPPCKEISNEVTKMGRPGGGAPQKTSSGKMKNFRIEDPQLRFQFHAPDRNMVDNDLRYRMPLKDQRAYKLELDEMVREKQEIVEENRRKEMIQDQKLGYVDGRILKLGSHPNDNKESTEDIEAITGGIELAPLLAARRRHDNKWPLHTSDVTKIYDPKSNFLIDEKEYHKFLERQISGREKRKQHEHEEDIQEGQKHHENWNEFWGRPGGGAPKGTTTQKENLEYMLYQLPIINRLKEKEERKNCGDCKKLPEK